VWPEGAVLLKRFSFGEVLETRAMLRRGEAWQFATWLGDGSRAEGGELLTLTDGSGDFDYIVPRPKACEACHQGGALGPRTAQLNGDASYDGVVRNQLAALSELGVFAAALPDDLPSLPPPDDADGVLADRARSWLHGNCAHCHRPGGWTPPAMDMDLRWTTATEDTNTCGVDVESDLAPAAGDVRIVPGAADESALWGRMTADDTTRMPPTGTRRLDPQAHELVRAWIDSMTGCPDGG